jgi:hypothetical protein
MRQFSSYGPLDKDLHYFAPRKELIDRAYAQLVGENPQKSGHYITVWAPRQTGKTWVMQEVVQKIKKMKDYEVGIFSIGSVKKEKNEKEVISAFVEKLSEVFQKEFLSLKKIRHAPTLFTKKYFQKPVILIIDKFDSLEEDFINDFANIFREIFSSRSNDTGKKSKDKTHLLHGLALVGVRSVLGIENVTGSPFNVQRSLHIPNLTHEEVDGMFKWYEEESGQTVEKDVTDRLYEPFESIEDTITETHLEIRNLVKLYQTYLIKNREWLLKDAPRRRDLRIYEAVYHFNLYSYLNEFLRPQGGRVFPEFPTGNGKIDLIVTYAGNRYGIELKSYVDERNYRESLQKAAKYGKQLVLAEIFLVVFVESIDDKSRKTYEVDYPDKETGVKVLPIFVETGNS